MHIFNNISCTEFYEVVSFLACTQAAICTRWDSLSRLPPTAALPPNARVHLCRDCGVLDRHRPWVPRGIVRGLGALLSGEERLRDQGQVEIVRVLRRLLFFLRSGLFLLIPPQEGQVAPYNVDEKRDDRTSLAKPQEEEEGGARTKKKEKKKQEKTAFGPSSA